MVHADNSRYYKCPDCGKMSAIYVLKVVNDVMIIKHRCPKHGRRAFRLNLKYKEGSITHLRNAVFRCYECGEKTTLSSITTKGPWALIKCSCPTHGIKLVQKIWNSIYSEITSKEVIESEAIQSQQKPQLQREPNPLEKMKFCPYCGTLIEAMVVNCNTCGSEIE